MTLNELKSQIKSIALTHKDIKEFQIGENFEVATSKEAAYPAVWLELPIYIDYTDERKKTFSMALSVLSLSDEDDVDSNFEDTSWMEQIADQILQKLKAASNIYGVDAGAGITLRNFSDDDLVGVRVELEIVTGRECDINEHFDG